MENKAVSELCNLVGFKGNYRKTDKKQILDRFRAVYEKKGEDEKSDEHNKAFFDSYVLEDGDVSDDILDLCECFELVLSLYENINIEEIGISTYQVTDGEFVKDNYIMLSKTSPISYKGTDSDDRFVSGINEECGMLFQITDDKAKMISNISPFDRDYTDKSVEVRAKMMEKMIDPSRENTHNGVINTCKSPLRVAFLDKDNRVVSAIIERSKIEEDTPAGAIKINGEPTNNGGRTRKKARRGFSLPEVKKLTTPPEVKLEGREGIEWTKNR